MLQLEARAQRRCEAVYRPHQPLLRKRSVLHAEGNVNFSIAGWGSRDGGIAESPDRGITRLRSVLLLHFIHLFSGVVREQAGPLVWF